MTQGTHSSAQVVAMHGWAGDSRGWRPWIEATAALGWNWQCGERGYGTLEPRIPSWPENTPPDALRLVIGHSLGPHLVAPEVLHQADAVVLLASFATFVPPDRAGRRVRAGLDGMAAKLGSECEAREVLQKFLANAADPQPPGLRPPGPADGPLHLERLRGDLGILRECRGLPAGFPSGARVLIVEAESDRIVEAAARDMLKADLPQADVISLAGTGHALLQADIVSRVTARVESWR
ncbi:MAG: hypothetical protein JHD33_03250 [Chthoniobacterales bacterium]|jgi:pimeloyl-[acyl-carrier protein] methyl ester esterase|nr:hypothetical protein [Chthoniobacterales bacterium]